jgi:hypothetical protein
MANNTYNGWKNRETWLVNLWYGDTWDCVEDVRITEILLDEKYEDLGNGILQDMIDWQAIDWEQLRSHVADQVAERM